MMAKLYTSDFWRTVTADTAPTAAAAATASDVSDVDFTVTLLVLTDWKNLEGSRRRNSSGELRGWDK